MPKRKAAAKSVLNELDFMSRRDRKKFKKENEHLIIQMKHAKNGRIQALQTQFRDQIKYFKEKYKDLIQYARRVFSHRNEIYRNGMVYYIYSLYKIPSSQLNVFLNSLNFSDVDEKIDRYGEANSRIIMRKLKQIHDKHNTPQPTTKKQKPNKKNYEQDLTEYNKQRELEIIQRMNRENEGRRIYIKTELEKYLKHASYIPFEYLDYKNKSESIDKLIKQYENMYIDQDPFTGENILLRYMSKRYAWETIEDIYNQHNDAIFHVDIHGRNALYYFHMYPEHQLDILKWYKKAKGILFKPGLWKHLLINNPSPCFIRKIIQWYLELKDTKPVTSEKLPEPHYNSIFDFLPSVHIPQQAIKFLNEYRSDLINEYKPYVNDDDKRTSYLQDKLKYQKNMCSQYPVILYHKELFNYWYQTSVSFHLTLTEKNQIMGDSYGIPEPWCDKKPWVKKDGDDDGWLSITHVRMRVNMIQLMVLEMAEYESIREMTLLCNKKKLNVPHGWWLWDYQDLFSEEQHQGTWEGPREGFCVLPVYKYQLVKKRIHVESNKPLWENMVWDKQHREILANRMSKYNTTINREHIMHREYKDFAQLEQWEMECDDEEFNDDEEFTTDEEFNDDLYSRPMYKQSVFTSDI